MVMYSKIANTLIVIERGLLTTYSLDDRKSWTVGRVSGTNQPDIALNTPTVSRHHGQFRKMNGIWFYLDHNGKNGTVYNSRHLEPGIKGREKPVILSEGDILIFGGGKEAVVHRKTVWSMFVARVFDGGFKRLDTGSFSSIEIRDGEDVTRYTDPDKGTAVIKKNGVAIYMGGYAYISGDLRMTGQ